MTSYPGPTATPPSQAKEGISIDGPVITRMAVYPDFFRY
jgi:hypothetical protein